jgi:urocanate hydratase
LANSYDEAIEMAEKAKENKEAISIGVVGNAADFFQYVYDKNIEVDLVTDQTSAHDPLNGYVPEGMSFQML